MYRTYGHLFFIFCFTDIFHNKLGGQNKNKNKIHSDHFPIELKSKETQLNNGPNEFYFTN